MMITIEVSAASQPDLVSLVARFLTCIEKHTPPWRTNANIASNDMNDTNDNSGFGSVDEENARLARRADQLIAEEEPIRLQFGTGSRPKKGFLNFDWTISNKLNKPEWIKENRDDFFLIPADKSLSIPDQSADFIFHEDFIEHLPQKVQYVFLAETLRVLKKGSVHRVNTPCLKASMRKHSKFSKGASGVYTGEWDRWGHQSVLTRQTLEEMAAIIGYSDVVFTTKNQSTSPHRCEEFRPGNDRDSRTGNIFADLIA